MERRRPDRSKVGERKSERKREYSWTLMPSTPSFVEKAPGSTVFPPQRRTLQQRAIPSKSTDRPGEQDRTEITTRRWVWSNVEATTCRLETWGSFLAGGSERTLWRIAQELYYRISCTSLVLSYLTLFTRIKHTHTHTLHSICLFGFCKAPCF